MRPLTHFPPVTKATFPLRLASRGAVRLPPPTLPVIIPMKCLFFLGSLQPTYGAGLGVQAVSVCLAPECELDMKPRPSYERHPDHEYPLAGRMPDVGVIVPVGYEYAGARAWDVRAVLGTFYPQICQYSTILARRGPHRTDGHRWRARPQAG